MLESDIKVDVAVTYLDQQSIPDQNHYLFAYTVTIKNKSEETASLITSHWQLTDGNGQITCMAGAGVVGKQPSLKKNEQFTYTSSAVLDTAVGAMQGSYGFLTQSGKLFDVTVPPFGLAKPGSLN